MSQPIPPPEQSGPTPMTSEKLQKIVEEVIARYLPDWGLTLQAAPSHEPSRDPVIWYVSLLEGSGCKISLQLLVPPGRPEELLLQDVCDQVKAYLRRRETRTKGFWIRNPAED